VLVVAVLEIVKSALIVNLPFFPVIVDVVIVSADAELAPSDSAVNVPSISTDVEARITGD